jgi:uncharacterized membrane protein
LGLGLLIAGTVAAFAALLHGSWCAFTNFKCGSSGDYAHYTGMIWSTLHGHPFTYGLGTSYLRIHLSFSLALLAPFFLLWDDPFLLQLLQWLCAPAGGILLAVAARRHGLSWTFTLALLFFWAAYPFTQTVMLSEFHGVGMLFLLLPWLYLAAAFHRQWVWLPLTLLAGLREETALLAVPLLAYFAARDRWRAGWIYAALALAYAVFALFALYPWINEVSIFAIRHREIPSGATEALGHLDLPTRLTSLAWVLAPTLLFLRNGWRPLLVIPSMAIVLALGSSYPPQYQLAIHYPAGIMALLAPALIEAAHAWRAARARLAAIYLVVVTLAAHAVGGLHAGGPSRPYSNDYREVGVQGSHALWVARHAVPQDGELAVTCQLSGFTGNRLRYGYPGSRQGRPDVAFVPWRDERRAWLPGVRDGTWGVSYFDDEYVVARRGFSTDRNIELLSLARLNSVRLAYSPRAEEGSEQFIPHVGVVRFGPALPEGVLRTWCYGRRARLPPGRYRAELHYRGEAPGGAADLAWGRFELRDPRDAAIIAQMPIEPVATPEFRTQSLSFDWPEEGNVEPVVIGQQASLWLRRVDFIPAGD